MSSNKRKTTSDSAEPKFHIDLTTQNLDLKPFPHPFYEGDYGLGCEPKTTVELTMMHLSSLIRSKPKWYEKMKDETIRNKWRQEASEQNLLTIKQIDYVLNELEYYNLIRTGSIEMSAVDGVWQSDELIPHDIKDSLINYINKLENIPENEKDWHPGTNEQVLDIVHPSLFCYVNKITRILNEKNQILNVNNALECIGMGESIDLNSNLSSATNKKHELQSNYTKSNTYQWLPAEFNISNDGKVTIESYINNLHPIEHKPLYEIIEQIFQYFIPLFNKCLTDLIRHQTKPNRISVDPYSWYEKSNDDENEDEDEDDEDNENRPIKMPDVGEFEMPSLIESNIDLRGRKLQVIVKLANIVLTPDNPKYPGGVWHVEGMENEHIVASGIYYYSSSNITQSNLQFRTVIAEPNYEQSDHHGVEVVYGLVDEQPLNQALGEVITQENRCIVFPNVYQHRVAPFQLEDPTQIGVRKILVFFLVDPSIRILSTAHIPPQQSHWLIELLRSVHPFNTLPSIVFDKIMSYVDYPMSLCQAKQYRKELMDERKYFISQNNELLFERPFSLCEH